MSRPPFSKGTVLWPKESTMPACSQDALGRDGVFHVRPVAHPKFYVRPVGGPTFYARPASSPENVQVRKVVSLGREENILHVKSVVWQPLEASEVLMLAFCCGTFPVQMGLSSDTSLILPPWKWHDLTFGVLYDEVSLDHIGSSLAYRYFSWSWVWEPPNQHWSSSTPRWLCLQPET